MTLAMRKAAGQTLMTCPLRGLTVPGLPFAVTARPAMLTFRAGSARSVAGLRRRQRQQEKFRTPGVLAEPGGMRACLETAAKRTAHGPLVQRSVPLLPGILRKRPAGVIMEPGAAARADTAHVLAEAGASVTVRAGARAGRGGEPVRDRSGRAAGTRSGLALRVIRAHRFLGGGGDVGCPFGLRPWALPPRSELPGEPPRPAPCPDRGSAGFLMGVLSLPAIAAFRVVPDYLLPGS
jgi:hypothetical protein